MIIAARGGGKVEVAHSVEPELNSSGTKALWHHIYKVSVNGEWNGIRYRKRETAIRAADRYAERLAKYEGKS